MFSSINHFPRHAIVIGGSLGGLFTGNMLRKAGWQVDIYERSAHDLDSRGGGIVLQREVTEVFQQSGVSLSQLDLGVRSRYRKVFAADGSILDKRLAPQVQTSWSTIYTTMKQRFGQEYYHQAKILQDIEQDGMTGQVTAHFTDGSRATGDLLIGADGSNSTVRQLLWPGHQPTYAGYIAWRGLVPENEIPASAREDLLGDFSFASAHGSHILGYLVPGDKGDTRPGNRLYNFVWYRVTDEATLHEIMTDQQGVSHGFAIQEGSLSDHWDARIKQEAKTLLPPAFRDVVLGTQKPFAQAIRDLKMDAMVNKRVILLGDAPFIPRPHTAASTSKAAHNALALSEALLRWPDDIDTALNQWEPGQIILGNRLYRQGVLAGNYLLFGEEAPSV